MKFDTELLESIQAGVFKGKSLDVSSQNLTNTHVRSLCDTLRDNSEISEINLSDNIIRDEGAIGLASLTTIKKLNLAQNAIKSAGVKALAKSNLEHLDLEANLFDGEDLEAFIGNTTLQHLDISDNTGIYPTHLEYLTKTKIKTLAICNMSIGDDGVKALSPANDNESSITTLYLTQDNITDKGIAALVTNKNLTKLNLYSNRVSLKGAELLSQHSSLTHLDLCSNQITDKAAEKLAEMTNLIELNLSSNPIENPEEIVALFKSKNPLIKIKIDNCRVNKKYDSSARDSQGSMPSTEGALLMSSASDISPSQVLGAEYESKTISPKSTRSDASTSKIKAQSASVVLITGSAVTQSRPITPTVSLASSAPTAKSKFTKRAATLAKEKAPIKQGIFSQTALNTVNPNLSAQNTTHSAKNKKTVQSKKLVLVGARC